MFYEKKHNMNIRDLTIEELTNAIVDMGEAKYRAKQIYEWLHKHKIEDIDNISNISKDLKEKLRLSFDTSFPKIKEEYISKFDETKKYLIELRDGNLIESVLMKYKYGYTICISSEVGCDMGCKFCASTIGGMKRNLDPHELLAQIYLISNKNEIDISNVVIMGSGEPLCNFENVVKFFSLINSKDGLNISLRNITLSTCGIVPNIKKLSEMDLPITLALSLHATDDETRKKIMPIANKYTLKETLNAMAEYYEKTSRRITFEYSLIKDVNDTIDAANNLIKLFKENFKGRHVDFNINLIPVNKVIENDFERPERERIDSFKNILEKAGLNVTVRRELGKDISGSCGQLRARVK